MGNDHRTIPSSPHPELHRVPLEFVHRNAVAPTDAAFDPEFNEEVRDLGAMADLFDANRVQAPDLKYLQQRAYNQSRAVRKKSELIARLKKRDDSSPAAAEDGSGPD